MKFVCSIAMIAVTIFGAGCSLSNAPRQHITSGQASVPDLMIQYGCPTCHVIPHVPGAVGKVGPSLDDLSRRSYLAGAQQNTPQNLIRWIKHPQQIRLGTAMPEMGVTSADAVRIAAFLQTDN
jgi:cytochrome c